MEYDELVAKSIGNSTAFSTAPFSPPASVHPMPPCSRWSTRLGILFSPRAIGSPPPPRRMRRAAGQPGRPPAGRQGLPDRTGSW
jgi:hypothetical protein